MQILFLFIHASMSIKSYGLPATIFYSVCSPLVELHRHYVWSVTFICSWHRQAEDWPELPLVTTRSDSLGQTAINWSLSRGASAHYLRQDKPPSSPRLLKSTERAVNIVLCAFLIIFQRSTVDCFRSPWTPPTIVSHSHFLISWFYWTDFMEMQ